MCVCLFWYPSCSKHSGRLFFFLSFMVELVCSKLGSFGLEACVDWTPNFQQDRWQGVSASQACSFELDAPFVVAVEGVIVTSSFASY